MDAEKTVITTHEESNKDLDSQLGHLVNAEDHEYGKWRAIRKNSWAFAWCMYSVWTVLLVSFENQASGTVLGIPEFRKDFGSYVDNQYVINSTWQGAITGVPSAM
jgi:SP family general alpha glucoside:H+ symporter-like MFS transporter